jgi:hypothetical protein
MLNYLIKQFGMTALGLGLLAGGIEIHQGLDAKASQYNAQAAQYEDAGTACKTIGWSVEAAQRALAPAHHGIATPKKGN